MFYTQAASFATVIVISIASAAAQTSQDYPTRPIRLIIPFTAGSATDLLARRIATKMGENWSQQVVVDNRGGGGGTVGMNIVAKAQPDGYTLLTHSIAFAMSSALYSKLPFDPIKDFAPASQLAVSTSLMVIAPSLGVKSVKELIALAKQKPGQLSFGSSGVGSGTHLNAEQFRFAAGIDVLHVPYKGVPEVLVDVMTGRIHYFLSPLVPTLPFLKDGRLIPLAVTTARRSSVLPDVPTMAEAALPGKQHVYLIDVRDIVEREQIADLDVRVRLLQCFAFGAVRRGLAVLEESGGHRPQPVARLDRALAQQHPILPCGNAAHDDLRVLIVDRPAGVAHVARQRVSGRNANGDTSAAVRTEVHSSPRTGAWERKQPAAEHESAAK